MNKRELIIHIGTEKTATSTIQKMLSDNRDNLRNEGIIYPSCAGINGGSQWRFISCLLADKEFDGILKINNEKDRAGFKSKIEKQLEFELEKNKNCNKVIISSEHFHSRLVEQKEILKLKNFLLKYFNKFKVIVYFRRQDRLGVSWYSTKIKSGNKNPLLFPSLDQKRLRAYYDHFLIYKNWAEVFGEENISANIFESVLEKEGGILKDFADICKFSIENLIIPPRENESLSHVAAISMLEMNKLNAEKNLSLSSDLRKSFYLFISEQKSKKFYPCSRYEAELFFNTFKESNEKLRSLVFPKQVRLFEEDFSDYPDKINFASDQAIAQILVSLWENKKNFAEKINSEPNEPAKKVEGFSSQEVIDSLYKGILGRKPDVDGFDHWVKNLEQKRNISNIVSRFIKSAEFVNKRKNKA